MANNNDDYIFGRLSNEMKQIEEQKRRNAQRVRESERNWLSQALFDISQVLGRAITGTIEFISNLWAKIFG